MRIARLRRHGRGAAKSLLERAPKSISSIKGTGSVFNLHVAIVDDGGLYILRFDERLNEWALIMFVSARG